MDASSFGIRADSFPPPEGRDRDLRELGDHQTRDVELFPVPPRRELCISASAASRDSPQEVYNPSGLHPFFQVGERSLQQRRGVPGIQVGSTSFRTRWMKVTKTASKTPPRSRIQWISREGRMISMVSCMSSICTTITFRIPIRNENEPLT